MEQYTLYRWSPLSRHIIEQTIINAKKTTNLPLLQATVGHSLLLVHLRSVAHGLKGITGGRERLEVCAVLLLGL